MRRRLYGVLNTQNEDANLYSRIYDAVMVSVIILSLVPLAYKLNTPLLNFIDRASVAVFIADYLARLLTADYALPGRGRWAFLLYPFTPMALVDLLSILPVISVLHNAFRLLRVLRLVRSLRVFKLFRYSKSVRLTVNVLKRQKTALLAVFTIAVGYIVLTALLVFNIEPSTFDNFLAALYWSTISLTTVGYGDIYPTSELGQAVTVVSSILGIGVVALPTGIITAGYAAELLGQEQAVLENEVQQAVEKDIKNERLPPG